MLHQAQDDAVEIADALPWVHCGIMHEITQMPQHSPTVPGRSVWFEGIAQIPKHEFGDAQ